REAIRVAGLASAGSGGGSVVNDVDRSWADLVLAAATAGLAEVDELGPLDGLTGDDPATLAAWLDHPGDPRAAAARVHVHPNTLRYRMTRISHRLDVDLGEPRVRDALRLLLRARDL
ncbi:MAG TPA: helix-turn-helix domain-containing protein, partial [Candidatus Avipropionibacterium avicola]|nr:helix-turn-helix domain-containing protein [Candidatus Avipropionibacterium avicola]